MVAAVRSSPTRYELRLERASPSASRTSGHPTTSIGRSRSVVMRRITASCCASLRPKYARQGPTIENNLATIVVTPSKWVGRDAPHSLSVRPSTCTVVRAPPGYISATSGTNSTSTPSVSATAASPTRSRWVGGEILGRRELRRVHEEADNDEVVGTARGAHERAMPLVEEPHRRDQSHTLTRRARRHRTRPGPRRSSSG